MKNGQQAEMILAVDKRQVDHRTKMVFKVHLRHPRDAGRAGSDPAVNLSYSDCQIRQDHYMFRRGSGQISSESD